MPKVWELGTLYVHIYSAQLWPYNTPNVSLQVGKTFPNEYSAYDMRQSDGKAPLSLELCEMRSALSLPLLLGLLWPGAEAPDRVLSTGQIKPFDI